MARPPREDRSSIVDSTLTLRLNKNDRELLDSLVEHQHESAARQGFAFEPTVAGYLRGLIRREAERLRIIVERGENDEPICARKTG